MSDQRWMQLRSGKIFYPFNPHPKDIEIEDIAHALSNICRFGGHTSTFYSVAQHSVFVSYCCGKSQIDQLWGLLHDGGEAYIGDVIQPLKSTQTAFKEAEKLILYAIALRFNLPDTFPEGLDRADKSVLIAEADDLMGRPQWANHMKDSLAISRYPEQRIIPWEPKRAYREFLLRYEVLKVEA